MFFKLRNDIGRRLFAGRCRGILDVAPVRIDCGSDTLVVSQLQHKDVLMYLVAIKSFAARVAVGRILILDDGSLTDKDLQTLRAHVPQVDIESIAKYRSPKCPKGGTWERLLAIAHHVARSYVIQLDADTLTTGALSEVMKAISQGSSFALGTWDNQQIETFAQRAADARRLNPGSRDHIQVAAEKVFDKVPGFEHLRYVRGCSGFAGFAPGSVEPEFIESFSVSMQTLLGPRWAEWGSEQLMSNVALANSPQIAVLPHPRYCDCSQIADGTAFVHFIGGCRFKGGTYAHMSRAAIDRLMASPDWR